MKITRISFVLVFSFQLLTLSGGTRTTNNAIQEFMAREGNTWSMHRMPNGTVRALYGPGSIRKVKDSSEALEFLSDYSEMFGIRDLSELRIDEIEKDSGGADYSFRQYVWGVPVVGSELAVHTNSSGRVVAAGGAYRSLAGLTGGAIVPEPYAKLTASRIRYADDAVSNGRLTVLPGERSARFAWKFQATSSLIPGQWAIYVDALEPQKVLRVQKQFAALDGSGTVFPQNPVVTPDLVIEPFVNLDESHTLSGKFVKTLNANFELPFRSTIVDQYTTAAEPDDDYTYPTDDPRFTEAMAYFHTTVAHDHSRALGFKKLNFPFPVLVNVVRSTGGGFDNAFYLRGGFGVFQNGVIVMGSGDFFQNFGFDSDVYYHEYGHAVLDRAKPALFEAFEQNYGFAFHEAFGDISAAAITENPKLAEFALHPRNGGKFRGRNIDNRNRFPRDVILKGFGKSEPHHTGLIAGGAWWDLKELIGTEPAESILFRSLAILPAPEMTFFDLRDSMLTADQRRNRGANATQIRKAFDQHGITGEDPGQKGSINIRSLIAGKLNFSTFTVNIKSTFKVGDEIIILANYVGTKLTPGYNVIVTDFQVDGPKPGNLDVFLFPDEAANGLHTGRGGVFLLEIGTLAAKPGLYTITLNARLGGTNQVSEAKTVKFRIKQS